MAKGIIAQVAVAIVTTAISYAIRPKPKPPNAPSQQYETAQGVLVNKSSNNENIPVVYGQRQLGIQKVFVENGSVSKFPVRADNFYVLRETKMTSLLFEFGFFDNEDDANLLMDKSFVFDVAYSLLNSLDNNKKMLK